MQVMINDGFVTNSSSTVHFFSRKSIEENPAAMAYINMMGLPQKGYIGATNVSHGQGDAIIWDPQIVAGIGSDYDDDYSPFDANPPTEDDVVMLYSDEVGETHAETLCDVLNSIGIYSHHEQGIH